MQSRRSPGGVICRHHVHNGLCEGPESKTEHFEAFMGPLWATRETGAFQVFLGQLQEQENTTAGSDCQAAGSQHNTLGSSSRLLAMVF